MVDVKSITNKEMTYKLLELTATTGYQISQHNGQRKFGPPPDWIGPPPQKGCEVFIGKLPREIYEDELVPIFSRVGKVYEMRLMMDFSGSNRGYAFVTYTNKSDANAAAKQLNNYEIRPGRHIGVVKSVDNCRLYVGGIPKSKTKEEVFAELSKHAAGIVDVILYKNCFDRRYNRGFAFVEFTSHRAAAMARRTLVPGTKLWDQDVTVDWAEPEPDVDDEQMKRVKVLYVRNFLLSTTPEAIQIVFEKAINYKIEKIKKMYDYAFIHFYDRSHAELAMRKLNNTEIDGVPIEIRWAKPVDRDLYRIQKLNKGNAKFNSGLDFSQTLLLYKQHLEKKEYALSLKEDEGIGSGCAGGSSCGSPTDTKLGDFQYSPPAPEMTLAPVKLDAMCKGYGWGLPNYEYQSLSSDMWVSTVTLPHVGLPLLSNPQMIGPFTTRPHFSRQAAHVEAAEIALNTLKMLRTELIQRSVGRPIQTPTPLPAVFPAILPQMPSYGIPYDLNASFFPRPPPVPLPMWRAA